MKRIFLSLNIMILIMSGCKQISGHRNAEITDTISGEQQTTKANSASDSLNKKIVETIQVNLNSDNILDSIILTTPPYNDPGEFRKIILKISGLEGFSYNSNDVWDKIDDDFLKSNKNLINSQRVFMYKAKGQILLLLFGFVYGAGREEFSIIQIKDNRCKMVFDDQLEFVFSLSDTSNDSRILLLARNSGEMYEQVDSLNADIGTYNPYFIYSIDNSCVIDENLTKKYNEENFVWAGTKYSEKVKVLHFRNGSKPTILK